MSSIIALQLARKYMADISTKYLKIFSLFSTSRARDRAPAEEARTSMRKAIKAFCSAPAKTDSKPKTSVKVDVTEDIGIIPVIRSRGADLGSAFSPCGIARIPPRIQRALCLIRLDVLVIGLVIEGGVATTTLHPLAPNLYVRSRSSAGDL